MYYDPEEDFRQPEPDIDEELKRLKNQKYIAEKEYKQSEKAPADQIKYYHSLLAIEERKSELLDKKYWKEYTRSADFSSQLEESKEKHQHEANSSLYLYLVCGFFCVVSYSGFPDNFFRFLLYIPFSVPFSLSFIVVCAILFHVPTYYFSKYSKIVVIVAFIITALVLTLSANNRI